MWKSFERFCSAVRWCLELILSNIVEIEAARSIDIHTKCTRRRSLQINSMQCNLNFLFVFWFLFLFNLFTQPKNKTKFTSVKQINIVLYIRYISACDLRTKSNTSCHSTPQHSSSDSEQPCDLRLFTPTTCLRELAVRKYANFQLNKLSNHCRKKKKITIEKKQQNSAFLLKDWQWSYQEHRRFFLIDSIWFGCFFYSECFVYATNFNGISSLIWFGFTVLTMSFTVAIKCFTSVAESSGGSTISNCTYRFFK